ncbi:general secretion pathway protein GspB [Psychromonas sp. 14N.309.X.WAT.B.A12]|uniref:general secretion pathway protein GspB n=1 Tax=Psychromonas sp. 14N.309.X.WAT.B.A12 TaxID=2998322 RepID=UPI0025B14336|nr:general secretion pathway protein GspB [Psychromonas sp. 14N.309.X.WAT.B.A12]MDN2664048.1 general secretion pathway protein GspB [Psychromonas sp. 14N.309.X.WAT.B.A12]
MSTILKALEKSKAQGVTSPVEPIANNGWKVMVVSGLLLIAILLGVVIFLLLRPASQTSEPTATPVAEVLASEPVVLTKNIGPLEQSESRVSEVQFKTIPLPIRQAPAPSWDTAAAVTTIEQDPALPEPINEDGATAQDKLDAINARQQDQTVLSDIDLDNVPDSLKQRFALAVEEEKNGVLRDQVIEQGPEEVVASEIHEMPIRFQEQIPTMRYDSHVYSSDEADRWIRINGVDMRVGDFVGDIELVDILPQQSVFRLGGQSFTIESLQDWKG